MGKIRTGAYNPLPVAPIVLVGANVNGKPNYMAVGFVNGVHVKPAIVYVSLNKNHHTPKGIIENNTFSLNVPSADYVIFGEVIQVYLNEELLGENRNIDLLKANPIYYSGLENRYRTLGEDKGPAWRIGRQYRPKPAPPEQEATASTYRCEIIDRSAQPALTIRSQVSPLALAHTIRESILAVSHYIREKGSIPAGPPFVAYHGFDGREQEVEIGFPITPGLEGRDPIKVSELPAGKSASYHYVGPYEKLPEVRTALEQWLNTNGYTKSGAAYEIYLNDPQTTAPKNLETELMYPLSSG